MTNNNSPEYPGLVRNRTGTNVLFVDVGIYGNAERKSYDARESTRKLEEFVRNVRGAQMLYADCYMTPDEFWEMFGKFTDYLSSVTYYCFFITSINFNLMFSDSSLYDWLRVQFDCKSAFPDVYQKINREGM